MCTRRSVAEGPRIQHSIIHWNPGILYPMDGQNVNVVWEPVPNDGGVPIEESFDVLRVYPERFGFSGDCGLVVVVPEGFEGFV